MVYGRTLTLQSRGFSDLLDVTGQVRETVSRSGIRQGLVAVTVVGSTASVSTIEFEPALVEDMRELLERLIPRGLASRHSRTWGDENGFSHMRATLMGPGVSFPVVDGAPLLGTWQQIVVIDHDDRPRSRQVRVQVVGE